ncbi:MAG: hypothetical protein HPY52_11490 [Firmicutes bacterium]|nr:hypothetical protein [Bacillota bacterium]
MNENGGDLQHKVKVSGEESSIVIEVLLCHRFAAGMPAAIFFVSIEQILGLDPTADLLQTLNIFLGE